MADAGDVILTVALEDLVKTGNDETVVQGAEVGWSRDDVIGAENWESGDHLVDQMDDSVGGSTVDFAVVDLGTLDDASLQI